MTRDDLRYKVKTVRGSATFCDVMTYRELRAHVRALVEQDGVKDYGQYLFGNDVYVDWEVQPTGTLEE